jgi:hypothetical protein
MIIFNVDLSCLVACKSFFPPTLNYVDTYTNRTIYMCYLKPTCVISNAANLSYFVTNKYVL